jgi:Raf kinase inhibitor-like YbhB/YbcL family protein
MPFALSSPAFVDGQAIPAEFTCAGENVSPPLVWRDAPQGTKSFVLVIEDPDAPGGVFRHWGLYNVPATQTRLARGETPSAAKTAVNDFGHKSYDGPCPPRGHGTHHYHFRLAALDHAQLDLAANAKVAALMRAAQPYVIATVELTGIFAR